MYIVGDLPELIRVAHPDHPDFGMITQPCALADGCYVFNGFKGNTTHCPQECVDECRDGQWTQAEGWSSSEKRC